MSSEVIPCPACRHPVRVPESLFGQRVRCPSCKSHFVAPTRNADGLMGEPELLTEDAVPVVERPRIPIRAEDGNPVFIPAMFLLLVGIIGSIVNGFAAYSTFNDPEGAKQRAIAGAKQAAEIMKTPFDADFADKMAANLPAIYGAVFGLSLLTLLGAAAMFLGRGWGFCVLGSCVAMINAGTCCCIIGMPVGIYCLIKLLDPEIRAYFRRSA